MKTLSLLHTAALALTAFLLLAAEPAQAQIPCGTTLTHSVTLQADIVCGTGQSGLVVGADNVTIDLNGYSLQGPWNGINNPVGWAVGISSAGYDGVTIVGGIIKGFVSPIGIYDGKGHFIGKVYAVNERGYPVYLYGVSSSVVENNDFQSIELGFTGSSRSIGNTIRGNRLGTAPGGGGGSLTVTGCGVFENEILDNDITGDPGQIPPVITVSMGAHGNDFVGNRVRGSVELRGAYNQFRKNEVRAEPGASFGLLVYGLMRGSQYLCPYDDGVGNNILDNNFIGGISGVRLQADAGNMLFAQYNRISGNRFFGQTEGIFFTISTLKNDAKVNNYARVMYKVIDHGQGNMWP